MSPGRRVLLVTPHFPPDGSAASHRVRLLAPYLTECGWEPVVLTVDPAAYERSLDPDLLSLVPPSLKVVRAAAWSPRWTRRVGIGDLGIRAFAGLRRAAADTMSASRFDALFVTIYPTYPALLGPWLKRRFDVPFVLDYQDPWVGSWGLTVGGGVNGTPDVKSRLTRGLAMRLEPIAVRAADAITAVSAGTYQSVLSRIALDRPPVVAELPLGWDAADAEAAGSAPTRWFDPADGAVHLSYVGTLLPNGIGVLRSLLGAARLLRDRMPSAYRRLRLHFFGTSNQFGAAPGRVLPIATDCGVADVVSEHAPRVPYLEALRILKQSSAILLLGSSEPHYTASKVYPAIIAARPILAVFHAASSAATLLEAFGRPPSVHLVTFDGDAPPSETIYDALAATTAAGAVYDSAAVNWRAAEPFSGRALAARLAAVFDQVSR